MEEFDNDYDYNNNFIESNDFFANGNKLKNHLFDGKFGKLYKTFNLQALKNKMWELLYKVV